MERTCPLCDKIIFYKNKISHEKSIKDNKPCMSCSSRERANRPEEIIKNRERNLGNQTWVGKKHSEESKEKIRNNSKNKTDGEKNGMYGKTYYDVWVKKYGKEIADEKLNRLKEDKSFKMMGNKNPMFSKPSPIGSGNGWSGWYKNWYFRSINELSFMINVIERFNLKWESGESKKYKITYIDYNNKLKNYFPDFIINDKYIVECKPKKLWNSVNVVKKMEGALIYCKGKNLIYKLMEIKSLTKDEIKILYENKIIKFIERYEKKYIDRYVNN